MVRALIIDGYTDEPAGLGVPPYIDVYPRYVAGAIWSADPSAEVLYMTIDDARRQGERLRSLSSGCDLSVLIAGVTVPGKYLSGAPATIKDALALPKLLSSGRTAICGPAVRFGFGMGGGRRGAEAPDLESLYSFVIRGDPETVIYNLIRDGFSDWTYLDAVRAYEDDVNGFAERGARIVQQHPLYPGGLICEIETYRGCPRSLAGGCSFCTEALHGPPDYRSIDGIAAEVAALASAGIQNLRLGRQPDLLTYASRDEGLSNPAPNPDAILRLFRSVRASAPSLRVLHIDNVNPSTVSSYPELSAEALRHIVEHHTPGDVAALGIESFDEEVVRRNNLKVYPDEAVAAIRAINRVGSERGENGLPHLLPGVNLVYGLMGETAETFEANLTYMKDILAMSLMVRRINMRQVMVMPSTRMEAAGDFLAKKHHSMFVRHKQRMRAEVDLPMLARVVPQYTVMRDVRAELVQGNVTWARQMGSYPVLVAFPGRLPSGSSCDALVLGHGPRSVSAIPSPIMINRLGLRELASLPAFGRKRAAQVIRARPFASIDALRSAVDDPRILAPLLPHISLS
jgi:radical SAM superfamily enzyme with C-terminal helix-hairpin-helix motif